MATKHLLELSWCPLVKVVGRAPPLDAVPDEPAGRSALESALDSPDQPIVRDRDDGDSRTTEKLCDRRKHCIGIDDVLEHFRADDTVEALLGKAQLVDFSLQEADVVTAEVLPRGFQVDARYINRSQVRRRKHSEYVPSARADFSDLESFDLANELANDPETPSLDEPNGKRRAFVVVVDGEVAREAVVQRLHVDLGHPRLVHRHGHTLAADEDMEVHTSDRSEPVDWGKDGFRIAGHTSPAVTTHGPLPRETRRSALQREADPIARPELSVAIELEEEKNVKRSTTLS